MAAETAMEVVRLTDTSSDAAIDSNFITSSVGSIDLGALVPGQRGTASATSSLTVTDPSDFRIQKTKEEKMGNVFSVMMASVIVNEHAYSLKDEGKSSIISINSGKHKVIVNVYYKVRDEVHPVKINSIPFLLLQHAGNFNNVSNSKFDNAPTQSNRIVSGQRKSSILSTSSVPPEDRTSTNGGVIFHGVTLTTMTFQTPGNAGVML